MLNENFFLTIFSYGYRTNFFRCITALFHHTGTLRVTSYSYSYSARIVSFNNNIITSTIFGLTTVCYCQQCLEYVRLTRCLRRSYRERRATNDSNCRDAFSLRQPANQTSQKRKEPSSGVVGGTDHPNRDWDNSWLNESLNRMNQSINHVFTVNNNYLSTS